LLLFELICIYLNSFEFILTFYLLERVKLSSLWNKIGEKKGRKKKNRSRVSRNAARHGKTRCRDAAGGNPALSRKKNFRVQNIFDSQVNFPLHLR
jgi:hypothetical protein